MNIEELEKGRNALRREAKEVLNRIEEINKGKREAIRRGDMQRVREAEERIREIRREFFKEHLIDPYNVH